MHFQLIRLFFFPLLITLPRRFPFLTSLAVSFSFSVRVFTGITKAVHSAAYLHTMRVRLGILEILVISAYQFISLTQFQFQWGVYKLKHLGIRYRNWTKMGSFILIKVTKLARRWEEAALPQIVQEMHIKEDEQTQSLSVCNSVSVPPRLICKVNVLSHRSVSAVLWRTVLNPE